MRKIFVFIVIVNMILLHLNQAENFSNEPNMKKLLKNILEKMRVANLDKLKFILIQIEKQFQKEKLERQAKMRKIDEEIKRKKDEEKRLKILNERLMPLTRGNGFLKDFYTGRF